MTAKQTFILLLIIISGYTGIGQLTSGTAAVNNYSIAQKRLLQFLTAEFVTYISKENLDKDSAMYIGRTVTHLPFLLSYPGYAENNEWQSTRLIDAGKINDARQLVNILTGEKRIRLLIDLGTWYLHQPGTGRECLDSAAYYLQFATKLADAGKYPKLQEECQFLFGELNVQNGRVPEAKKIYASLITLGEKEGNLAIVANATQLLGGLLDNNDTMKLRYYKTALLLYERLKLNEKQIEQLWEIAKIYFKTNPPIAQKYLVRAVTLQKSSGFQHALYTDFILALITSTQSDNLAGLEFAKAALSNMKWSGFSELEPRYITLMGIIYGNLGHPDEAMLYFRKALSLRYKCPHIFWYNSLLLAASELWEANQSNASLALMDSITKEFPPLTKWEKKQLLSIRGECYVKLNNHKLADETFDSLYNILVSIPEKDPNINFRADLQLIAEYYVLRKAWKKALRFVDAASPDTSHYSDNLTSYVWYSLLYKIDSSLGRYKSALQNHIKHMYYFNLWASMDQRNKFSEITVKYAADKKDQDIKLLKQQAIVQQVELRQNKLGRAITLAAMILMLFIIALLFNQYLLKQRTNNSINKKNAALNKLVAEKEWLLKEVHHRVKNNLQTVVSLLELQSDFLDNEALSAIHDSQNRIYAMSLIHQKLYQSDNVASINMRAYLQELADHLREIYHTDRGINFIVDALPIDVDVSQAIPVGLIVNEAVTNAIKYAFTGKSENAAVTISFQKKYAGTFVLTVADNGAGLPEYFDATGKSGLGFKLIKGLVEDIEGQLSIDSIDGTQITVLFNLRLPFHEANNVITAERTVAA
ncbi:MAG: sensor histidine kinase [Chitinophagaceae bacterium]